MTPDVPATGLFVDRPYAREHEAVLAELGSSRTGLSAQEAATRLASSGANRLPERRRRPAVVRFLAQMHTNLISILLGSAVIQAVYRDWLDFGVLLRVSITKALIRFIQKGAHAGGLSGVRQYLSV